MVAEPQRAVAIADVEPGANRVTAFVALNQAEVHRPGGRDVLTAVFGLDQPIDWGPTSSRDADGAGRTQSALIGPGLSAADDSLEHVVSLPNVFSWLPKPLDHPFYLLLLPRQAAPRGVIVAENAWKPGNTYNSSITYIKCSVDYRMAFGRYTLSGGKTFAGFRRSRHSAAYRVSHVARSRRSDAVRTTRRRVDWTNRRRP